MQDLGDIFKKLAIRPPANGDGFPPVEGSQPPVSTCERCGGRGWFTPDVPVGHHDFGRIIACDCQQQRIVDERHHRLLRYSNLGNLKRFTFETFCPDGRAKDAPQPQIRAAYDAALAFAADPKGWLVLTGPNGAGKTHLAAAIGNRVIQQGNIVLFTHVADLLDHLRSTFSPTSEIAYSQLFEQVKSTPLLILDGIGNYSTTPWAEEKLMQIVNHRFDLELPTVMTISGSLDELDRYIVSRIRTPGLSRILELPGMAQPRAKRLGGIEPQMLQRMTFELFDSRGNNPSAEQRASLDNAMRVARNYAADPDGWLTIIGETGVGKTHLAVAIAVEQLKRGRPVFYAFVPELLDYLRYTFSPEAKVTYDNIFDEIKNAPLLILDDLGQEHSSPWANEKLYQIVVHRHNARLPTVITSMIDFTKERGPIGSRVQDPSVGQLVRMDAPDYRNKNRDGQRGAAARRAAPRRADQGR